MRHVRTICCLPLIITAGCEGGGDVGRSHDVAAVCLLTADGEICASCDIAFAADDRDGNGADDFGVCVSAIVPTPTPSASGRATPTPEPSPPPTSEPSWQACTLRPAGGDFLEHCYRCTGPAEFGADGLQCRSGSACVSGVVNSVFPTLEREGLTVHLREVGGAPPVATAQTGEGGAYSLCGDLPAGDYEVEVRGCDHGYATLSPVPLPAAWPVVRGPVFLEATTQTLRVRRLSGCGPGPITAVVELSAFPGDIWREARSCADCDLEGEPWRPAATDYRVELGEGAGEREICAQLSDGEGCELTPVCRRVAPGIEAPDAPQLIAPAEGERREGRRGALVLEHEREDITWLWEISAEADFATVHREQYAPSQQMSYLLEPGRWYWRVQGTDACGLATPRSEVRSFVIEGTP